ncbi:MAG TPA: hypothetical protein VMP08_03720 [Anaerolineae bacterium]|nr:hypothetical protein [Anaerolineae bacterium]
MIDYLTHYYHTGTPPFRSLSTLPDEEALQLMTALCDDTPYGERFKDPLNYLHNRRRTEEWVRASFTAKGGQPREPYPIYMVLGFSPWIERAVPTTFKTTSIRIPLTVLADGDVSFTYPDSMISHWFGQDQSIEFYQPAYHGKIFTRSEILAIVAERGLPEDGWEPRLPDHLAPYIEAQIWNREPLLIYQAATQATR